MCLPAAAPMEGCRDAVAPLVVLNPTGRKTTARCFVVTDVQPSYEPLPDECPMTIAAAARAADRE